MRERLVFKGGTALKRCYFGDYRFSEDLDFSLASEVSFESIMAGLEGVYDEVQSASGIPFRYSREDRKKHRNSHTFYLGPRCPPPPAWAAPPGPGPRPGRRPRRRRRRRTLRGDPRRHGGRRSSGQLRDPTHDEGEELTGYPHDGAPGPRRCRSCNRLGRPRVHGRHGIIIIGPVPAPGTPSRARAARLCRQRLHLSVRDALACTGGTLVVYMGLGRLVEIATTLQAAGLCPETPVAVVRRATSPEQLVVRAPLCRIAGAVKALEVKPPALVIIGEVARQPWLVKLAGVPIRLPPRPHV